LDFRFVPEIAAMLGLDPFTYLAFVAACAAIVVVPGPTVTVIIANSLRHGSRAGLLNVAGTQLGLAVMLVVLAAGLDTVVQHLGTAFDWIRLIGAAYLVWLGIKLWRSDGRLGEAASAPAPRGGFFWQGMLVVLSNPKALFFFGAFIPQFLNTQGDPLAQTLFLGATFMIVATCLDGAYALASGHAGSWLSRRNVRLVERISGTCLIGGGAWLALSRQN
jgi:threonine/homoserine/homoserine lactone efflux protein